MKKLLACGLILAMLSSTGAMCFANEEIEVVNAVEVSDTEMDEIKETQDEKEIQKEELLNGLGEIKKDSSLTWKEKALRGWEYVKNFVKQHYKAIGFSVLAVLACIFGAKFVGYVLSLINSNDEEAEKEEAERLAKEQAEKEEAERLAKEQAEKEEAERLAKEQAEKEEVIKEEQPKEENTVVSNESQQGEEEKKAVNYSELIDNLNKCKQHIDAGEVEDAQLASADVFEVLEREPSLENLADEYYDKIQKPLNKAYLDDEELDEDITDKIDAMIEKFESFQK